MTGLNDVRKQVHPVDGVYFDAFEEKWVAVYIGDFMEEHENRHEAIKHRWLAETVYHRDEMLRSEAFDYMREADLDLVFEKLNITLK